MNIFIMCAGDLESFKDDYIKNENFLKPLITINGITLIDRTVNLINKYSDTCNIFIVSDNEKFLDYCLNKYEDINILKIPKTNSLCESILHTVNFRGEQNVILLGDVYYSEKSIVTIIGKSSVNFLMFGRFSGNRQITGKSWGELFGYISSKNNLETEIENLNKSITQNHGKLWGIFWSYNNISLKRIKNKKRFLSEYKNRKNHEYLNFINDTTEDFDFNNDLSKFAKVTGFTINHEEVEKDTFVKKIIKKIRLFIKKRRMIVINE